MFNNEYEYLVHLIRCAINDLQPTNPAENISLEKVFDAAKKHEVANISFVAVEKIQDKISAELYKKWKTQYIFSMQRDINQEDARNVIVSELNKNNIRSIELQGTVIKKLYPYTFWRNMSDIDFVVDKQNLSKAEEVLRELGYTTKAYGDHDVSAYANPKIAVEIHTDFFAPDAEFYGKMINPFNKAVLSEDKASYISDEKDIFLYNILHCIKHLRGKGAGIRRILDIYYLNNLLLKNMDKQSVFEFLASLDCKRDYDNLSAIADEWFSINGKPCGLYDVKRAIYVSGTHGSIETVMLRERDIKFVKLRKIWLLIFPKKAAIYSGYGFCAKHKLPILLCWIYRWGCLLFVGKKRKYAMNILTDIIRAKIK